MKKLILILGLMLVVPVLKVGAACSNASSICSCTSDADCKGKGQCNNGAKCKDTHCKEYSISFNGEESWKYCNPDPVKA